MARANIENYVVVIWIWVPFDINECYSTSKEIIKRKVYQTRTKKLGWDKFEQDPRDLSR